MKLVTTVVAGLLLIASALIPLSESRILRAAGQDEGDARFHVVTSIEPLTFFVQEIGGDAVSVSSMVPPGQTHIVTSLLPARWWCSVMPSFS